MAKFGAEKIWRQFLNITENFATEYYLNSEIVAQRA